MSHMHGLGSAGPQCSQEQQGGNFPAPTAENSPIVQGSHPRGCSTAPP